jgi:hypothetical protein
LAERKTRGPEKETTLSLAAAATAAFMAWVALLTAADDAEVEERKEIEASGAVAAWALDRAPNAATRPAPRTALTKQAHTATSPPLIVLSLPSRPFIDARIVVRLPPRAAAAAVWAFCC